MFRYADILRRITRADLNSNLISPPCSIETGLKVPVTGNYLMANRQVFLVSRRNQTIIVTMTSYIDS